MTSWSGTETMVQLGAADKLVGVGEYVKNYMYGEKGKDMWNATLKVAPYLKDLSFLCISASGCLDFEMHRLVGKIAGKEDRAEELISYAKGKIAEIKKVTSQIPEAEKEKVFSGL